MTDDRPVIGFDLGHGETALALAYVDAADAPKVLDLPGASRRQHVSAVALLADGRAVVGEEAIRADDIARLWLAFKSRNLDDPDTRSPMQLLVKQIVADIVDNGTIPDQSVVRWVFGAPSGWTPEHYAAYERLLDEIGLSDHAVIAESRAALLYARDSGEVDVMGKRIRQGVLIVDIGSSTTDYTYVTDLAQKPVDHGNVDLGAALIDREIQRRAVDRHPKRAELIDLLGQSPQSARRLELACRESKEKFFRTRREELAASGRRVGVHYPLEMAGGEEFVVDLRLSVAEMDAVLEAPQAALGGRSWMRAFAEDVEKAVQSANGEVDLLLLTGGPSRMPFVVDVCRKIAGSDRVALGNEPEVAIARGLALAGRTSIRSEGFRRDIAALEARIRPLVKEKIPELARAMGNAVASGMTERHVIPAFVAWRDMEIDTLGGMVDQVVRGVRRDLEASNNARIGAVTTTWQNQLRGEIDNITRPICNRWHIVSDALRLPTISVKAGTSVAVNVDTKAITSNFDAAANVVNAVVASVVGMTLFGAGTALIASTGPFAVVVAAVIGFGLLHAGKEELMERMQTYKLPRFARRMQSEQGMASKLRAKADANEAELAANLAGTFEKEFQTALLSAAVANIMTQLDLVANEAELLIA